MYEKHSELDEELRKMKGRVGLLGNQVFDQSFDWAEFQELGSAPPSMEAARRGFPEFVSGILPEAVRRHARLYSDPPGVHA